MSTSQFTQLVEQRLTELEERLAALVDKRLTDEVKKILSIAEIDLPFALAKARYVLELVIRDIYQRELPSAKPKPLFNMIEALCKIDGLFSKKLDHDINYIRLNGNLMAHVQDQSVAIAERDVEVIVLLVLNIVEWYVVSYAPTQAGRIIAPPVLQPPPPNPYRGLKAFQEQDSEFFYGRGDDAKNLVARVTERPLVPVVGASGSGKSSLVYAGLLPLLRARGGWQIITLRPQNRPFDELAKAVATLLYTDKIEQAARRKALADKLASGEVELAHLLDAVDESSNRLLIVVDQFEELYTLNPDAAVQQGFVDVLLGAIAAVPTRLCVLITLRADFMVHALGYAPLAEALDHYGQKLLGPIRDAEMLRTIIEQPAVKQGVTWESLLVERILRDLREQPIVEGETERVNLPLLQFTLEQLWQRQIERTLTHVAYEELGGVQLALARHADAVLERFDSEEQEALRHIFVQLVRPGEGTEDTRQVATQAQIGAAHWRLVSRLADERLVVTGQDEVSREETVEVVHEALLRHWQPLREWINQDRTFRVWQNGVRAEQAEWEKTGRDEGLLLRGARLAEAEERLAERGDALSQTEQDFINASIELRQRERAEKERQQHERAQLQRRAVWALGVGFVISLILGVAAWGQWQEAKRHATRAEQNAALAEENAARAQKQKQMALEVINTYTYEIPKRLANIPLTNKVIEKILNYNIDSLEQIFELNPDDHTSQRTKVSNLIQAGDLWLNLLGDANKALQVYRESHEIISRLAATNPSDQQAQKDLSLSHDRLGDARLRQGDVAAALANYEQGLAIRDRLATTNPEDQQLKSDMSVSYEKLGDALLQQGNTAGALKNYKQSLTIRERLVTTNPEDRQVKRNLSVSYERLGDVLLQQGDDTTGALKNYKRSLAIRERLAAIDPANRQAKRDLSVSYNKLGDAWLHQGDTPGAVANYEQSLMIQERLAADPADQQAQRDLSVSFFKLGSAQAGIGKTDEALHWFEKAQEQVEKNLAERPNNVQFQKDLAAVRGKLREQHITVLFQQANQQHKAGNYPQAVEWLDQVLALDENNVAAYWNRSKLHHLQDQIDKAIADLQQVIELAPHFPDAYGYLGWHLILKGKFNKARHFAYKAHELDSKNYVWMVNLGHVYLLLGERETARRYYEKMLPLIPDETAFQTGPVADFELFIERGWQVEACRAELAWMRTAFAHNN